MSFTLGSVTIADEGAASRLQSLIERERQHPYQGRAPQGSTFGQRLRAALSFLSEKGLDAEAAAILTSCVDYITEQERRDCWRTLASEVAKTLELLPADLTQCPPTWISALPREPHVYEFFQAVRTGGRSEQPFETFVDLWNAVERAYKDTRISARDREALQRVRTAARWLLLWDFNLSGRSVSGRLKALRAIADVLFVNPVLAVACGFLSPAAEAHCRKEFDDSAIVCAGRRLPAPGRDSGRDRLGELLHSRGCEEAVIRRACDLCEQFRRQLGASDSPGRNVGSYGYDDGGFLLVYQGNCANNSVPLLWQEAGAYPPPFPRTQSDPHGKSKIPEQLTILRDTPTAREPWKSRIAYFLGGLGESSLPARDASSVYPSQELLRWWHEDFSALKEALTKMDAGSVEAASELINRLENSARRFVSHDVATAIQCCTSAAQAALSLRESLVDAFVPWSRVAELERSISAESKDFASYRTFIGYVRASLAQRILGEGRARDYPSAVAALAENQPLARLMPPRPDFARALPDHRFSNVGLPGHLRLNPDLRKLYTTRLPNAAVCARVLNDPASRSVVLAGPLGFGKTTFIRSLDAVERPVLMVDLADAHNDHELARALIDGLPVSEVEIAEIDRDPVPASIRLLAAVLMRATVVVMENADRAFPSLAPGFTRAVEKLRKCGHTVVVERWTPGHARLRDFETWTLDPLADKEISAWAVQLLGRVPEPQEIASVQSYAEGSPLFAGWMLSALASLGTCDDPELAAMQACEDAKDEAGELFRFLGRLAGATSDETAAGCPLSDDLASWLAVLPYVDLVATELGDAGQRDIDLLRRAGLILNRGNRWHTDPWCRAIGLWRTEQSPEIVATRAAWLAEIAGRTTPEALEMQRRHLHILGRRVPSLTKTCERIVAALPLPRRQAGVAIDRAMYAAPLPAATATGSLATDLRLWELESATRSGDLEAALSHLERLVTEETAAARDYLAGDWYAVRQLHHALLRLPVGVREKARRYGEILPLLKGALEQPAPAMRFWCSRLLAFAARTAMAAGEVDCARSWIKRSEDALESANWGQGEAARHIKLDTRYRLARAASTAGASLVELGRQHRLAYQAIPNPEEWPPNRVEQWAFRRLRHLKVLLRQGDASLVQVAKETFLLLPPSLRWFQEWIRYQEDVGELPDGSSGVLLEVLTAQRRRLAKGGSEPRLAVLADLVVPPSPIDLAIRELCRLGEAECADVPDRLDLELARLAARVCTKAASREFMAGTLARAALATKALLPRLDRAVATYTDDPAVRKTRRLCLAFCVAAEKRALSADSSRRERDRCTRAVDWLFRDRAQSDSDPWLWVDWADARIALARRLMGAAVAESLRTFLARVKEKAGGHYVADIAALLVGKYLWDYEDCYRILKRLLPLPMVGEQRLKVVRWGVEALQYIVLEPQDLRDWNPGGEYPEVRALFVELLREYRASVGEGTTRTILAETLDLLEHEDDPDAWAAIARAWELRIGDPSAVWGQLIALLNEDPKDRTEADQEILDQLTDIARFSRWAGIFRRGASASHLPLDLRLRLALLGVTASQQIGSWRGRDVFSLLHRGVSVGLALRLAGTGTLFNDELSEQRDEAEIGKPRIPWRRLVRDSLDEAEKLSCGRGRFHDHIVRVRSWLIGSPLL